MILLKKNGEYYLLSLETNDTSQSLEKLLGENKVIASTTEDLNLIKMSKSQIEDMISKMDLEKSSKSKMLDTKFDFPYKNYYQIGFIEGYHQAVKDFTKKDNSSWIVRVKTDPVYQEPVVDEYGLLNILEILH